MLDQPTRDLAKDAGAMDTALAYIADELHTALVGLDQLTGLAERDPLMRSGLSSLRGRIERLSAYVADVQARTAPASTIPMTPGLVRGLLDTYEQLRTRGQAGTDG